MVPHLSPVDCDTLVRFFEAHGFQRKRMKGSYLSMAKSGALRPVVIPMHSDVAVGVVMSCLRTAGLTREDLLRWLAKQ